MDFARGHRLLKRRISRWWDRRRAPWPIVRECHWRKPTPEHFCNQCRPDHLHRWFAWPKAPAWIASGHGIPVRCVTCGARKCDMPGCNLRRHSHVHGPYRYRSAEDMLNVPRATGPSHHGPGGS